MLLLAIVAATPAKSQTITPANDGTGTTVNQNGNQFNIQGGTRNGGNLFHSFDKFKVNSGQTANFLTTPDTTNIFGSITGGNASYVNGLIQVIGGNSNLFLMNPAGIIFGPNATLNIPASFSVTTATGIGFDNNNYWFEASGINDYSNLVGNPSGYRFNVSNPGVIVNEGNLSLNPGENLTLLGGIVINIGELSTLGGNITIGSVEDGSTLRISKPGNLLNLEVGTLHAKSLQNGEDTYITPLSLPKLLTGGDITHASSVTVNADGDVVLTDSNQIIADTLKDVIASGNIDVSSSGNVGGEVNVLESLPLINTNDINGEGTIFIGGDLQKNTIIPNSHNILAARGSSGAFLNSPIQGVEIGNVSNTLVGIPTLNSGAIEVKAQGDIIVTKSLPSPSFDATADNITVNKIESGIDTNIVTHDYLFGEGNGGNISVTTIDDINTGSMITNINQVDFVIPEDDVGAAHNMKINSLNNSQIVQKLQVSSRNSLTVDIARKEMISGLEKSRIDEYSNYFGVNLQPKLRSTKSARDILAEMEQQTGKKSAVIYVNVYDDKLQLILFTADGKSILKTIHEVNRVKLKEVAFQFYVNIIDRKNRNSQSYLPLAQKLYNWLISPMTAELEAANIDTLLLSMDNGFRLLPVAALHDGEQFLIEKYNISLIPSISLMNSNYNSLKNTQVLAMGASEFYDKPSLPAVPVELTAITQKLWQGNLFLNEKFTRKNLISQRQKYPYPIIHLATHAEFRSGDVNKSYIQLWDEKLKLHQIRELGWNNPEVELLVLSACRTAVGDKNSELGFAGLAIATGVKSALASLWLVNDEATLGLMTEFYSYLGNVNIKAEALRKAQLAMLKGKVAIADGTLRGSGSPGEVSLPAELGSIQNKKFSHPYYWAGFTMVGSPW